MRDSRNQIAETDDFTPTPLGEEHRDRVRRLVCAHAVGNTLAERVADAESIMRHLGIHPQQEGEAEVGAW